MIHCLGNSHVWMFNGWIEQSNPVFTTHWLGPTISYNFYEHHFPHVLQYLAGERNDKGGEPSHIPIPTTETLMFVCGEVDCRWHLPKQAQLQRRNIDDLTHECVERYARSCKHAQNLGYKIVVWGAHPSTTGPHNDDPQNPVFGDVKERNRICKSYNRWQKEIAEANEMAFVSIYDYLVDENNVTKMEYYLDYCHLNGEKVKDFAIAEFRNAGVDLTPPQPK